MNKMVALLYSPKVLGAWINLICLLFPRLGGKVALRRFCTPTGGKGFTPKEEAFLAKAQQESVDLDGNKLQCYVWGDGGKKVLLAHGFDSNAARWRALVPLLLRANCTLIAFDALAHGNSEGKQLDGVLYARSIEAVMNKYQAHIVIGHSFGGMALAYYFTHLAALKVEKMIFMAVPSKLSTVMNSFSEALGLRKRSHNAMEKAFFHKFGFPVSYVSVQDYIQEIPYPGLVIHDKNDPVIPFTEAQSIAANWNNSELFPTQKLGHHLQSGDVFKAVLREVKTESQKQS